MNNTKPNPDCAPVAEQAVTAERVATLTATEQSRVTLYWLSRKHFTDERFYFFTYCECGAESPHFQAVTELADEEIQQWRRDHYPHRAQAVTEDGMVLLGTIHLDIENETETFTPAPVTTEAAGQAEPASDDDLLPCPFCGSEEVSRSVGRTGDDLSEGCLAAPRVREGK